MLKFFKNVIGSLLTPSADISTWYQVHFDENTIWRDSRPPRGEGFSDSLRWEDISRIVFEASRYATDDTIYIFTHSRPESYAIPADAGGGARAMERNP